MKLKILTLLFFFSALVNAQQTPDEIGRDWINKNRNSLKISNDQEFILRASRSSLSGHTLRYQQAINGIPVFDTEITIHISKKNEVTNVANNYDNKVTKINTTPAVFKASALEIAKSHIKAQEPISREESKLYVYNKTGVSKLVHVVNIKANLPTGFWQIIVDATSGEIIEAKDISLKYHTDTKAKNEKENNALETSDKKKKKSVVVSSRVDGTGMVFDPDPLSASTQIYGTGGYTDNNDATNSDLDAARSSITLRDIDFTGGIYTLKGPYVEIKDIEAPNKGIFQQVSPDFTFNRNDDAFEAVNCYYHLDKSLRYINETLGITLVSLFNNGVLEYDPSGWDGNDNSSYSTGQLSFGEGGVDDAEDADVILHELGHGLHDWITNGSLSQVQGLSEGCGDYWAQSYKRSLGQWQSTDASYHYVFGWDGHNEYWTGRATNYAASYPAGIVNQIHTDGQIWATSLMRIFDIIGREKTDKAFLEGLGMTNSGTNQQNAAIAVRQAAIDMNYSCTDIDVFTTQFSTTGYTLPAIPLSINCPGDQSAPTDGGTSTYTIPDYTGMGNAINTGCTATITQSPVAGTVVSEGMHVITLTATSGTSVNCMFNLTVDGTLGTEDIFLKNGITFYPIPTDDHLIVKGTFDTKNTLEIYNMVGQKMMEVDIDQDITKINVTNLPKGIYFASFRNQKGIRKIIKK